MTRSRTMTHHLTAAKPARQDWAEYTGEERGTLAGRQSLLSLVRFQSPVLGCLVLEAR